MVTGARKNASNHAKRIIVRLRTSVGTERGLIPGIIRHAHEVGNWRLLFPGTGLGNSPTQFDAHEQYDGVLASGSVVAEVPYRPVVIMGDSLPPLAGPAVSVDNAAAGVLAARHLLSLGTKHIGYLGIEAIWSLDRTRAFEAEVRRHRRTCIGMVFPITEPPSIEMILKWVRELPLPIAVLAGDDFMAVKLLQAVELEGIHVPEQLAVLGVNNDELCCAAVVPSLSSVAIPWDQIGYEAARCLDMVMQGKALPQKVVARVAPTGVVQRGSTQIMAYGDPLVCDAVRLIRDRAVRQAVSAEQIAADLGVHRVQLARAFQKCAGFTPKQEIDRVRGDQLREYLNAGQLSLKRIVYEMGFASLAELCRFSRRVLGCAPGELRGDE